MYFVHSNVVVPENSEECIAETDYGGVRFCSVLRKGNICGCQFHPERSGKKGLAIYKNFAIGTSTLNEENMYGNIGT
jgi:glutamine amidotransferase